MKIKKKLLVYRVNALKLPEQTEGIYKSRGQSCHSTKVSMEWSMDQIVPSKHKKCFCRV